MALQNSPLPAGGSTAYIWLYSLYIGVSVHWARVLGGCRANDIAYARPLTGGVNHRQNVTPITNRLRVDAATANVEFTKSPSPNFSPPFCRSAETAYRIFREI